MKQVLKPNPKILNSAIHSNMWDHYVKYYRLPISKQVDADVLNKVQDVIVFTFSRIKINLIENIHNAYNSPHQ